MQPDPKNPYLVSTFFLDADTETVRRQALHLTQNCTEEREKAVRLFYWVRDAIPYDPYAFSCEAVDLKASSTLAKGVAWCVPKAVLLAALARAVDLPSRLHLADIRNHQATAKVLASMQTDIFYCHGYTELLLGGRWTKLTPAFNRELCQKFAYPAVEFDGYHDGLLSSETLAGDPYIEYLFDRGTFADLPLDMILTVFKQHYPFAGTGQSLQQRD